METALDRWPEFTKRIYNEWDADPGYYAIQHSSLPKAQQMRLVVAWCSFYNLGIAARASELSGSEFWKYLNGMYPTAQRSSERRHFRGAAGLKALASWQDKWPKPEAMVEFLCDADDYFAVRKKGKQVYLFGDYFYWKICDLHEVLGFGPVDMVGSEKYSPKVPQQGADRIFSMDSELGKKWTSAGQNTDAVAVTYAHIAAYGVRMNVPPRTTTAREFGIQEAETVCCVYKQMLNGKYTYGTRTAKAILKLESVPSKTAKRMADTLLELSPHSRDELMTALASLKE